MAPFVLPQHGVGHRKQILMTIKGQGLAPSPVLSHIRLSREAVFFQVMHQDAKALDDWGMGCCLGTIPATYCRLMPLYSSLNHQLSANSLSLHVTVPLCSPCTAHDCSIHVPRETQGQFQNFPERLTLVPLPPQTGKLVTECPCGACLRPDMCRKAGLVGC